MAVNQYRKDSSVNYVEEFVSNILINNDEIPEPDYPDYQNLHATIIKFEDDNNLPINLQMDNIYALSFTASNNNQMPMTFSIVDDLGYTIYPNLNKIFTIPEYDSITRTIIFSPSRNTSYLRFKIKNRLSYGSPIGISDVKIVKLLDLLQDNDAPIVGEDEQVKINKIGIMSDPGSKFYINHEEVIIGSSGIYEFSFPSIKIISLAAFSKDANDQTDYGMDIPTNYFIIDYQYDE